MTKTVNNFRIKDTKFIEASLKYNSVSQQEAMKILEIEHLTYKNYLLNFDLQKNFPSRETVFFTGIYQRGRAQREKRDGGRTGNEKRGLV